MESITRLARRMIPLTATAGSLLLSTHAFAQGVADPVSSAGSSASETVASGEVIVTARRREESALTVPVSITALTQAEIREKSLNSREQLSQNVAGLSNNSTGAGGENSGTFMIRGQGQSFGGTPGVLTYFADVAGIALGNQNQSPLTIDGRAGTFIDLENIQVLKGPQGTLFGRNTTGGNILFVPHRPTNELGGYITAGLGNYFDRSLEGAVNIPVVTDRLLVRVSGGLEKRRGFVKDFVSGKDYQTLDYQTARVSILFAPTDTLKNTLIARYYHYDQGGPAFILTIGNPAVNPQFVPLAAAQAARGPYRIASGPGNTYDRTTYKQVINTTSLELTSNLTLKNIISYGVLAQSFGTDVDGTPLSILTQTGQFRPTPRNDVFTEELQAFGTLLGDHLNYTIGLYTDHAGTLRQFVQDFQFYPFAPGTVPPLPATIAGLSTLPDYPVILAFNGSSRNRAVYGQATLDLGVLSPSLERVKITGGLRYTKETINQDAKTLASVIVNNQIVNTFKNSYPSFTAGVSYEITPELFTYFNASNAYKSGGVNAQLLTSDPSYTFDPERVTSYELGLKTSFRSGGTRLSGNLTAFRGDYQNIQRTVSDPARQPAVAFIENVAAGIIQGVELDAKAETASGFGLALSYAYTDARYTKVDALAQANLAGAPFPNISKNRVAVSPSLVLPLPESAGRAKLYATYTYQSRISFSQSNAPSILGPYLPGYGLVSGGLDWSSILGQSNLDLKIYVRNLFDKEYVRSRFDFYNQAGFVSSQYGEPRTYGASLNYAF